jgi:hypothetical protein
LEVNAFYSSRISSTNKRNKQMGNGKSKKKTYDNGNVQEGTFENNKLVRGKWTLACGNVYDGVFKDNKLISGKITFTNGDVEEGSFKGGKLHGKGKITFANGKIKVGYFNDGKLQNGREVYNVIDGKKQSGYKGKHKKKRKKSKTPCRNFVAKGYWPYGGKCHFSHEIPRATVVSVEYTPSAPPMDPTFGC